jgi:hypothetical protein
MPQLPASGQEAFHSLLSGRLFSERLFWNSLFNVIRVSQERFLGDDLLKAAEVPLRIGWSPGPVLVVGAAVGLVERIFL